MQESYLRLIYGIVSIRHAVLEVCCNITPGHMPGLNLAVALELHSRRGRFHHFLHVFAVSRVRCWHDIGCQRPLKNLNQWGPGVVPKVRGCAAVVSKKSQGKDALENLKVLSRLLTGSGVGPSERSQAHLRQRRRRELRLAEQVWSHKYTSPEALVCYSRGAITV